MIATTDSLRPPARALAPDVARGLMLLLIAVANSTWYLWGRPSALASAHPTDGSTADRIVRAVMAIAVDGRVYPLFAFLFGYGMVQFARSRAAQGFVPVELKRMLQRRHLAMLLIGFVHALLLFAGDIVGAYGFIGLVLVAALFDSTDKTLKIVFWVAAAYAAGTGLLGLVSLWWLSAIGFDLVGAMAASGEIGLGDLVSGWSNYLIAMAVRVGMWLVATLFLPLSGVIPAAIVLGWLFARHRVLEEPERYRRGLTKLAVGGITVGWLTGVPTALEHLGHPVFGPTTGLGWAGLHWAGGMAGGFGYAALFALWVGTRRVRPGSVTRAIAAVGKRSLTCYLLQSVMFAPLLAAWGLGLGARINTALVVLIALGVWLVTLVVANILEARNARGPAEIWLRKVTHLPGLAPMNRVSSSLHQTVSRRV